MYRAVIFLALLCVGVHAHGSTHFDMENLPRYLHSSMMESIEETLKKSLHSKDLKILSVKRLSDSHKRNLIVRFHVLLTPTKERVKVILKQSLESDDDHQKDMFGRFARDWAGLAFMNNEGTEKHMPMFYGANEKYRYILMEDLSADCKDYAIILTSDRYNKSYAESALESYYRRLARFHVDGYKRKPVFSKLLSDINPRVETWQTTFAASYNDIMLRVNRTMLITEYEPSPELHHELFGTTYASYSPGAFSTVIHGDLCPDNMMFNITSHHALLFDFEWVYGARNALLDMTKLRMGMPGCWCRGELPKDLLEHLESIYREELMVGIPEAADDEAYNTAYVESCGFRILKQFTGIEYYVDDEGLGEIKLSKIAPVISRLETFIEVASKYQRLPELRKLCEHVLRYFRKHRPEARIMDLYAVFEDKV